MKRLLLCVCVALLSACSSPNSPSPTTLVAQHEKAVAVANDTTSSNWIYFAKIDQMVTHGVDRYACITSTNTVDFDFPYSGAQSALFCVIPHVGSDGHQHYDAKIVIDRGQLLNGRQGNILVKLDDNAAREFSADPPDDGSTTTLFFSNAPDMAPSVNKHGSKMWKATNPLDQFVEHLQSAAVLKAQVTAYRNGRPVFTFKVAGFSLAKLGDAMPDGPGIARTRSP